MQIQGTNSRTTELDSLPNNSEKWFIYAAEYTLQWTVLMICIGWED